MEASEWPLLFFTLFAQTSFGLVAAHMVLSAGRRPAGKILAAGTRRTVASVAFILMVAAMGFSFFHLGSPSRAVYAMANLRSSWLSREILMVIVFGSVLLLWWAGLNVYSAWGAVRVLGWLAAVSGTLMVFSMASIYMIETIPSWNTSMTLIRFFSSGLLTGGSLYVVLAGKQYRGEANDPGGYSSGKRLGIILALALVARLAAGAGFPHLSADPVFPPPDVGLIVRIFHYTALIGGTAIILPGIFIPSVNLTNSWNRRLLFPFLLILAGEVAGRYIFYAGYYRLGI